MICTGKVEGEETLKYASASFMAPDVCEAILVDQCAALLEVHEAFGYGKPTMPVADVSDLYCCIVLYSQIF